MTDEISYLNENSPIKVGYINDYLPFCDRDESTGELIGALNEYLTLARDCARLAEEGYEVKRAAPFDLFPRTVHVETVVCLVRKNTGYVRGFQTEP